MGVGPIQGTRLPLEGSAMTSKERRNFQVSGHGRSQFGANPDEKARLLHRRAREKRAVNWLIDRALRQDPSYC